MKKEILSEAMNYLDDRYLLEAARLSSVSRGKEQTKTMKSRRILKITLIAAVLVSLFVGTAFAAALYINSPEQAVKVAQQELKKMQELGLLSRELSLEEEPDQVYEFPMEEGSKFFPGRIRNHRYSVRSWNDKYSLVLDVDTKDGKIRLFNIQAKGDETDEILAEKTWADDGSTYYWYNNFDDIFPADITIDTFCSLLAEYWGFSGYRLSGTQDGFYGYDTPVPDGSTLLRSICDEAYLTVFFEGDQEGIPMYVELNHYINSIGLTVGTSHTVG